MEELLGKTIICECGKVHHIPHIKIIEKNINNASDLFSNAFFIADLNTAQLVKLPVEQSFVFNNKRPLATLENVKKIIQVSKNFPELVSIGSGSLTDLVRYAAFLSKKSYSCIPTAPSVDAYTSTVAPILINGVKQTLKASIPNKILLDFNVLKDSPSILIKAGVADISAKILARTDWILSNVLHNEYICPFVWKDIENYLKEIPNIYDSILQKDIDSIKTLTKAQLISGINMVIIGSSRPASGAEHVISHLIEMSHEDKDELPPFHGLTVAIGLYISYKAYKVLMDDIKLLRKEYTFEERKKDLFSILSEQKALDLIKNYKIKRKMYRKYDIDLNKIKEEIQNIHNEYFPLLSKIIEKLDILSLISNYNKTFIMKVIRLSNMVRNRFTILDLFEEMNILKNFSELFFQL